MIVLMRELVHETYAGERVRWYHHGKDGLKCKTWMGAEFDEEKTTTLSNPGIEAFGRQLGLFIRWVESIDEEKKWQV